MPDEPKRFEKLGFAVDAISKLGIGGIGIGATLIGIYLTHSKQEFDKAFELQKQNFEVAAKCAQTRSSIFEFTYGKNFVGGTILDLVNYWVPDTCTGKTQDDRDKLVRALGAVTLPSSTPAASTAAPDWSSLFGPSVRLGPSKGTSNLVQPFILPGPSAKTKESESEKKTQPQTKLEDTSTGWVAVGYLNSADFNFVTDKGASFSSEPKEGVTIRAKWQVNVRSRAADWTNVKFVLNAGDCFEVSKSKTLMAGKQQQIWSEGKKQAKCPSS